MQDIVWTRRWDTSPNNSNTIYVIKEMSTKCSENGEEGEITLGGKLGKVWGHPV